MVVMSTRSILLQGHFSVQSACCPETNWTATAAVTAAATGDDVAYNAS